MRVAVLGVGQVLRGDDAAGILLARLLLIMGRPCDHLLVVEAGPALENHVGALRRFGPDLVLIVDAAQMDTAPGTVQWLNWQRASGLGACTHTVPLSVFGQYLTAELNCEIGLIGIQPADTTLGASLFPAVRESVKVVAQNLAEKLELCLR